MKYLRVILLAMLFLVLFKGLNARDDSKQLASLCKVWGVLKYFHPTIQKGKVNWEEAFKEAVKEIETEKDVNQIVEVWLNKLGEVKEQSRPFKYLPQDPLCNNLSYSWIRESSVLSNQNKDALFKIVSNYKPKKNKLAKNDKAKTFYRDKLYHNSDTLIPNKYEALHAFAKYWNVINYFYPCKNNKVSWDSILVEFLPKIAESSNSKRFYYELAKVHHYIYDNHGFFYNYFLYEDLSREKVFPIYCETLDGKTYVRIVYEDYENKYGLHKGCQILEINNRSIEEVRDSIRQYEFGTHELVLQQNVDRKIFATISSNTLELVFVDLEGKKHKIEIPHEVYPLEALKETYDKVYIIKTDSLISNKYGYINLGLCDVSDFRRAFRKLRDLPAVILDTRVYGGLPAKVTGAFISNRRAHFANMYQNSQEYPGTMRCSEQKTYPVGVGIQLFLRKFKGKIVLLANENNTSGIEYQLYRLKALRDDIIIIGRNTAGAMSTTYTISLFNNTKAVFSQDIITTPDMKVYNQVGYPPDIYVDKKLDAIKKGKDEILEYAIEYLDKEM